jgi:hypothetical protein
MSQTLDHKGVPLKPITTMIQYVYFNLVQLITANEFLIKIEKDTITHTHTLHRDFTLETQIEKTNNLFRVSPLILIHHHFHYLQYNIYRITQHPKTLIHLYGLDYNPNSLTENRKPWAK